MFDLQTIIDANRPLPFKGSPVVGFHGVSQHKAVIDKLVQRERALRGRADKLTPLQTKARNRRIVLFAIAAGIGTSKQSLDVAEACLVRAGRI